MDRSRRDVLRRWAPVAVWMGVIFTASSLPGKDIPTGYSAYGHFTEFAILGALAFIAASKTWPRWRAAAFGLALASAYGITDELHQFFTPGRTPDPVDWATDTLGAALGIALVLAVRWALARKRARRAEARA